MFDRLEQLLIAGISVFQIVTQRNHKLWLNGRAVIITSPKRNSLLK